MRLVRQLLGPYRGWLAILVVALLVETAMSIAAPWPLKIILDSVVGTHKPPDWLAKFHIGALRGSKMELAAMAALGTVLIAVLGAIASYVENYYTESVAQWVAYDLRNRVYDHLQRLSLAYYDSHQLGTILSTIIDDVKTIQGFASSGTLGILVDLLTIVGMLGIMFWLNWDFAGGRGHHALPPHVRGALNRAVNRRRRGAPSPERHHGGSPAGPRVGAGGEGIRRRGDRGGAPEGRRPRDIEAALAARRVKSILSPSVSVAVALCTAFVLYRGTALILTDAMTVGDLTVFLAYLSKFFKPVQDLAKMSNSIAQTAVATERIETILGADQVVPERPGARDPDDIKGEIVFDHVAFAYDPREPVLRDVSFTIAPGQSVGVVGTTGGGKSTIVSLIPRFYDASQGSVKIDGVEVREYSLHGLRSPNGFVLQDTVLFRGTVRENIAYGRPSATHEEIVEAARLANADEFIARMPHGADTLVGSAASRSRAASASVGIARAVIRRNPS
jgi:subfamily B ATP-binding cassette protein MsbA